MSLVIPVCNTTKNSAPDNRFFNTPRKKLFTSIRSETVLSRMNWSEWVSTASIRFRKSIEYNQRSYSARYREGREWESTLIQHLFEESDEILRAGECLNKGPISVNVVLYMDEDGLRAGFEFGQG